MEWISIKDSLPEIGKYVLVHTETEVTFSPTGKINIREFGKRGFGIENVTHWMPLPEPPNKPTVTWQYATHTDPNIWLDASDDEYEIGQHLAKYNWRQIEK